MKFSSFMSLFFDDKDLKTRQMSPYRNLLNYKYGKDHFVDDEVEKFTSRVKSDLNKKIIDELYKSTSKLSSEQLDSFFRKAEKKLKVLGLRVDLSSKLKRL